MTGEMPPGNGEPPEGGGSGENRMRDYMKRLDDEKKQAVVNEADAKDKRTVDEATVHEGLAVREATPDLRQLERELADLRREKRLGKEPPPPR
jgi:hypothetical protein